MSATRSQAAMDTSQTSSTAKGPASSRASSSQTSNNASKPARESHGPSNNQKKPSTPGSAPAQPRTAPRPQVKPAEAPQASNWINRTIQGYVGSAGNLAGSLVYGVGDSINQAGERLGGSITNTTRTWGEGVSSYSNDIKDAVRAGGPRIATAGNPLGLSGAGQGKALSGSKVVKKSTSKRSASNPLGI